LVKLVSLSNAFRYLRSSSQPRLVNEMTSLGPRMLSFLFSSTSPCYFIFSTWLHRAPGVVPSARWSSLNSISLRASRSRATARRTGVERGCLQITCSTSLMFSLFSSKALLPPLLYGSSMLRVLARSGCRALWL